MEDEVADHGRPTKSYGFLIFHCHSAWPQRMCACGYGHCLVKVSRSHKNPGRAYYVCPRPVQCGNWIGWCDESGTRIADHDSGSTDVMQLRADVVNIFNTLCVMKTVICVLCIMVIILLLRM